jgi:cytochrome P450
MSCVAFPTGPRFWFRRAWSFLYHPKLYYAWLRQRYGEIVTLPTADGKTVWVLTSEGARDVLTHDPDAYDAFNKKAFVGLAGAGSLWVLDGARHRNERRLLSPRFSAHHCCHYGQAILEIAVRHTETWQAGQTLNAYSAMLDVSVDVILSVIFGAEDAALIDAGRATLKKLSHAARPSISFFPTLQARWFPPWARYRRAKREFSAFVTRLLAERRRRGNDPGNVLGLMLSARHRDGQVISDADIHDELITILTAGHETTAVALSWALYELGRHPAV